LLVSNSLLHHLPDPLTLWRALPQLACPGALVVIMDLHRPQAKETLEQLVMRHAADAHPVLQADFRASLHAAYTCDEVAGQLREAALSLSVQTLGDRHWIASGVIDHVA
jgi:2-polyprenyl-3-methyl-5-hydroxy-6-metoxy-1,4-benzoquinol methylase